MATTYKITTGTGSATYRVSTGSRGPVGPAGSGGGGVTDHGALTGLADDDHTQYHTDARGDARYAPLAHTHELDELAATGIAAGKVLTANGAAAATWETPSSSAWDGDIADINLDGGTDIGADLADADLILVDDGAGGTNRKSAISRLWTYILGKLTGANNITFGGQLAASAQSATPAANDLMTRALSDARYHPAIVYTASASQTSASSTLVDITSITGITLERGVMYEVLYIGRISTTDATDVLLLALVSTKAFVGGATNSRYPGVFAGHNNNPTNWYCNPAEQLNMIQPVTIGNNTAVTEKLVFSSGVIVGDDTATLALKFARNSGAGTITHHSGAKLIFRKIP